MSENNGKDKERLESSGEEAIREEAAGAEAVANPGAAQRDFAEAARKEGSGAGAKLQPAPAAGAQIDVQRIWELVKNPLSSLKLDGNRDFIYGLLGIAASLIGFMFFTLIIGRSLPFIGWLGLGGTLFGKMLLLAIISNTALHASIWLIGLWQGKQKLGIKPLITHIGALQYGAGAAFIVAGLLYWVSFNLCMIVLLVALLALFTLSIIASLELYNVAKERFSLYIMLTTAAYAIITMLVAGLLF